MAITIGEESGNEKMGSFAYYLDDISDVPNLPTDSRAGSSAFVIATQQIYMINSRGEWIAFS